MDTLIDIIKWVFLIIGSVFALGVILSIVQVIKDSIKAEEGKRAQAFQKGFNRVLEPIKPYQVLFIAIYYFVCIGVVLTIAYQLLRTPPTTMAAVILGSETALFAIRCFICGCLGATVYGMLWISKSDEEKTLFWKPRRYILLPPLGALLGSMSYFFLKSGLMSLNVGNQKAQLTGYVVYTVAFLSGFASRELTEKLIQVAQTVFTKVHEPTPELPKMATEYELSAVVSQWEKIVKKLPTLENFKMLADLHLSFKNDEEALKVYKTALTKLPNDARSDLAQIYYNRAAIFADQEDTSEAIDNLKAAIDNDAKILESIKISETDFNKIKRTKAFLEFKKAMNE